MSTLVLQRISTCDQFPIADVADDERRSANRLPEAARQIIQYDDRFATLAQLQDHMAADVTPRRP